jgi:hypothetical protein
MPEVFGYRLDDVGVITIIFFTIMSAMTIGMLVFLRLSSKEAQAKDWVIADLQSQVESRDQEIEALAEEKNQMLRSQMEAFNHLDDKSNQCEFLEVQCRSLTEGLQTMGRIVEKLQSNPRG